jgi:hypothetical protein
LLFFLLVEADESDAAVESELSVEPSDFFFFFFGFGVLPSSVVDCVVLDPDCDCVA